MTSFILVTIDETDHLAFDSIQTAARHLVDMDNEPDFDEKSWAYATKHQLCTGGAYEGFNCMDELSAEINDLRKHL